MVMVLCARSVSLSLSRVCLLLPGDLQHSQAKTTTTTTPTTTTTTVTAMMMAVMVMCDVLHARRSCVPRTPMD